MFRLGGVPITCCSSMSTGIDISVFSVSPSGLLCGLHRSPKGVPVQPPLATRNERTRTVAVLPLEAVLRDAVPASAYQRLAPAAGDLRLKGWSDHSIAVEFGVTDRRSRRPSGGLRGTGLAGQVVLDGAVSPAHE